MARATRPLKTYSSFSSRLVWSFLVSSRSRLVFSRLVLPRCGSLLGLHFSVTIVRAYEVVESVTKGSHTSDAFRSQRLDAQGFLKGLDKHEVYASRRHSIEMTTKASLTPKSHERCWLTHGFQMNRNDPMCGPQHGPTIQISTIVTPTKK